MSLGLELSNLESRNTSKCVICETLAGDGLGEWEPTEQVKDDGVKSFRMFCPEHTPFNLGSKYQRKTECRCCGRPMFVEPDLWWAAYCSESCRAGTENA